MPQNIYERVKEISEFRDPVLKLEAVSQYSCKEKSAGTQKRSITSADPEMHDSCPMQAIWMSLAGEISLELKPKARVLHCIVFFMRFVLSDRVTGQCSCFICLRVWLVWSISSCIWGFWYELIFSGTIFLLASIYCQLVPPSMLVGGFCFLV